MFRVYLFSVFLFAACTQQKETQEGDWVQLLDKNSLEDWVVKMEGQELGDDQDRVYKIEDHILKIYDDNKNKSTSIGHIFYKQPHSHFRLRFEYRFTGKQFDVDEEWPEQYGGIVYHAQSPKSMGLKQAYPISLEFQLLGGRRSGNRSTGNVCTIGTQVFTNGVLNEAHCINSRSTTYDGDQWISAEIEVLGDSLARHYIEGELVLEYTRMQIGGGFVSQDFDWEVGHVKNSEEWIKKDGEALVAGFIGLQAHDPIEFRKLELMSIAQ